MHSRKFKWASPLFIIFLALASVFGAFSAVVASQKSGDNQVIEKAEAASSASNLVTTGVLSKVGIEIQSNSTTSGANADYFLQTWGSSNQNTGFPGIKMLSNCKTGSHWVSITSLGGKNYTGYTGAQISRWSPQAQYAVDSVQSGWSNPWNSWQDGSLTANTKNFFKVDTSNNFSSERCSIISVYYVLDGVNDGVVDATHDSWNNDAISIGLGSNPSVDNYTFNGWYKDAACQTSATTTGYITSDATIYAKFTHSPYTMTFKPNGGSGSQVTREKTHGIDFTVPTPASLGIGAGAARVMLHWADNQDGSGSTYNLNGTSTYSGNANHDFWLIQDYKSYEYSVDGGSSWVQMPQTTTAESCIATYASSESNYLPAGQIITIREYYGSGSHTAATINEWTGNTYAVDSDHYVSIGTYNKIVLYVHNDGTFTADVWGGSARGVAIDRGGFVTKYECELNETTHNFTGTVTVLPGDKIEAFYDFATVYAVTMTNYASYGIDVNGNVSVPAVYTFTVTYAGPNDYPTINVDEMVAADTAKLIAQTFNTDLTEACEEIEGGASASTLNTPWTTHSTYYSKLSSATKTLLASGSTSDTDIRAMRLKYDRIVSKHGKTDYMDRKPSLAYRGFGLGNIFGSDDNNITTIIIVVASSVALLSVTALSILVIKKRKQKEE